MPGLGLRDRLGWALHCARVAYRASRRGRVIVPVEVNPQSASLLVGDGLDLGFPVVTLHARPSRLGGYVLAGSSPPDLGDADVAETMARCLDLLVACEVTAERLPALVDQARRRVRVAVDRQAQRRMEGIR